jgi:hypothetical protein
LVAPGGSVDASFVRAGGPAPAPGTITAWYVGGMVALPSMPIRQWIKDYVPSYNGGIVKGGEDGPADGMACLLAAASLGRSTKGADIVAALEQGIPTKFASTAEVFFAPDRHLSLTRDDLMLVSLEYPRPELRYNLGSEWKELFKAGYEGPVALWDYTYDANRRAQPAVMEEVARLRFGTSCRPEWQDANPAKITACKAVH